MIGVEGRIQTRSYDNQQGQRVYVTEVVTESVQFLEAKNASSSAQSYGNNNAYAQPSAMQSNPYAQPAGNSSFNSSFDSNDTLDISSDDLPF